MLIRCASLRCALFALVLPAAAHAQEAGDLSGLWVAKRRFGPDARGTVLMERTPAGYVADLMGFTVPVREEKGELWFDLPDGQAGFRGRPPAAGDTVRGFWFSTVGNVATPVTLAPRGRNRWAGTIVPLDDTQTFYLLVRRRPDGSLGALLRNLERDYGGLLGIRGVVRNGDRVSLVGGRGSDSLVISGSFDSARQVMTLTFPFRGGSYDFRRDDDPSSAFYPRGTPPTRYVYRAPPALDDGWPTASLDDVGIDRAAIERAVQQIVEMSMDSINAPQVHALLIVRRGRLVLEEYFHGEHRDKLHNTRSGSKSVTATIAGAAMHAGAPVRLSTPVYQVVHGGTLPADLEPRKRAMTLEHLLTMSSGYFCDDNNEDAPGNEDGMWNQTREPDFFRFGLRLPMAMAPGEQAIYCSINPHVALHVVGQAMNESPLYLFARLVAGPMGIRHYAWTLDRARNPYGGGGMALRPRDYLKFGQLMLDSGTWRGQRLLSRDFVTRATSPLFRIGQRGYGLLWWTEEHPWGNRRIRGFAALGNGGQIVMVFPELELVIGTQGGSYGSRGWRYLGGDLIPNSILPAVAPAR